MAEASILNKVEDIITCSLCREVLTEPKTFLCLHSFCKGCVESLELVPEPKKVDTKPETTAEEEDTSCSRGYCCPLCRRFTPQPEARSMHIITQLLDAFHTSKKNISEMKCNKCHSKSAKWYCQDCESDNFLCNECKTYHDMFLKHKVFTVEEFKQCDKLMEKPLFCEHHSSYKVELYCTDCDKITCVMCKILHHDGHKAEPINTAIERLLPKIKEHIEQIQKNVDEDKIELQKLKEKKAALVKKCDLEIQDVEDKVSEKKQVIKWIETALNKTQGITLLTELQDGLLSKLQQLAKCPGGMDESMQMYASRCFPWLFDSVPSVLNKTVQLANPGGSFPYTRLAMLWKNVAVFSHPTGQIFLYDVNGNQTKILQLDHGIRIPRTAVQVGDDRAMLVASTGVYLIDQDGKEKATLVKGDFSDVCFNTKDKLMYALEHIEGKLVGFTRTSSGWEKTKEITLQNYKNEQSYNGENYVFTFLIANDIIYLARCMNHKIAYYDMNGMETRPSTAIEHFPSACGIDSGRNVLISRLNYKDIGRIDANGMFKQLLSVPNRPWYSLFQDENTLWVILADENKLLKYCTQ